MFFYSLLGYLLEPLQRLAAMNLKLQDALVAVDRLYQVLELEAEPPGDAGKVPFAGVRHALELQGVSFRYGRRGPVLDGVSLRIPAGRTVAVIGESGSGKSTLLKLLLGFYRPTEGRILTGWTCATSTWRRCAAGSAWSPRARSSSRARCGRTSPWAGRGRRWRR
jgi:ATP-binding cassette subfamily B protein